MTKLSIIVISFNEAEFLPAALDSILNQNLKYEYEIIIGDDGSSDGSLNIIEEYERKHKNIKHFVMDRSDITDVKSIIPSIRVTNIIKKGMSIAEGEYIKILSGDDLLSNGCTLGKQIEVLDDNQKIMSCYTDYEWMYSASNKICNLKEYKTVDNIWANKYIHISCFMFRKEVENSLLERFCDDTGLIFSIYKTGPTKHLEGIGFRYRQRDNSIMHKADRLELCILEMMIYQDVLNATGLQNSSRAHFALPLLYVYLYRRRLNLDKYQKYISNCQKYDNDILGNICELKKGISFNLYRHIIKCLFMKSVYILKR